MAYDTPKVNMASISSQQITEVKRSLLIRNMGVQGPVDFRVLRDPRASEIDVVATTDPIAWWIGFHGSRVGMGFWGFL